MQRVSLKLSVNCRNNISGSAVHCTVCKMLLLVFHFSFTAVQLSSVDIGGEAVHCVSLHYTSVHCILLHCRDHIGGETLEARRGNQQPTTNTVILSPFFGDDDDDVENYDEDDDDDNDDDDVDDN